MGSGICAVDRLDAQSKAGCCGSSTGNGKVLFQKKGDKDIWLRYVTYNDHKSWMLSTTKVFAFKEEASGFAHCIETGLSDPAQAKRWCARMCHERFVEQASMVVIRQQHPMMISGLPVVRSLAQR